MSSMKLNMGSNQLPGCGNAKAGDEFSEMKIDFDSKSVNVLRPAVAISVSPDSTKTGKARLQAEQQTSATVPETLRLIAVENSHSPPITLAQRSAFSP